MSVEAENLIIQATEPSRLSLDDPDLNGYDNAPVVLEDGGDGYNTAEELKTQQQLIQMIQVGLNAEEMLSSIDPDEVELEGAALDYLQELQVDVQAGKRARVALIELCLPVVENIAKGRANRGMEMVDLVQEGSLGLMKAIDTYDSSKGVPLMAYVVSRIGWAMGDALREQRGTIRMSASAAARVAIILAANERLGDSATYEQLADATGLTVDRVREDLVLGKVVSGLDVSEVSPQYTMDSQSKSAFDHVADGMRSQMVQEMIGVLDPEEVRMLDLRYGLTDGIPQSCMDVGKILGCSNAHVSRTMKKIEAKLRASEEASRLSDFIE